MPAILWKMFCNEQINVTWNFTLAKFTHDLRKGFAHACSAVLAQRKIKNLLWKSRTWLNLVKSLNMGLGLNIKHWPVLLTRVDPDCDIIDRHCKISSWAPSNLTLRMTENVIVTWTFFYYTRKGHRAQFSFSHTCILLNNHSRELAYFDTDGKLRHPPRTLCSVHQW